MRTGIYVQIKNTTRLMDGMDHLQRRGAEEACLAVVDGLPGLSKTSTVHWWAVQNSAVYLRAKKKWTPAWLLRELLAELGETPANSFEKMFAQILQRVTDRQMGASLDGSPFTVIIDEADHIVRRSEIIETLRDITDVVSLPMVLVGMDRIMGSLTRYPQIMRRVSGRHIEFKPLDFDDVQRLLTGLSDVPLADDVIELVTQASRGYSSETVEALAVIERVGKRNPGTPVTRAMLAGQTLFNDRATTRPVVVPR